MILTNILIICAALLILGLFILVLLTIPILLDLRRTLSSTRQILDTADRLTTDLEVKVKGATRFLDTLSLAMGGLDGVKKRMTKRMSPYLWPSRVIGLSLLAGLKRGVEVFFGPGKNKKQGRGGN